MEKNYIPKVEVFGSNTLMYDRFNEGAKNYDLQTEFEADNLIIYDPEDVEGLENRDIEYVANIGSRGCYMENDEDLVTYEMHGGENCDIEEFGNVGPRVIGANGYEQSEYGANTTSLEAEFEADSLIIYDPEDVESLEDRDMENDEGVVAYELIGDENCVNIEEFVNVGTVTGTEGDELGEYGANSTRLEAEFEECDNVDIAAVINSEQWSEDNYDDFIEDELEREEEMEDLERAENGGSDVDEDISEDEVNSTDLEAPNQVVDSYGNTNGGRPKPGRKRKIPNQSRADRKRLSNTNKTHVNTKGKLYLEKKFNEHFECLCKRSCTAIVPVRDRRRLFTQFWSMGTFEGRCALLMCCVTEVPKKRSYSKENIKTRLNTRQYSMYGTPVCQKTLLMTLQINESRVTTALEKYMNDDSLSDLRGKLIGGWNALPVTKTLEVRVHIASFPKYISHYTRSKTESKYLNSELSLAKMYQLYRQEVVKPVSLSFYYKIFCTYFNLRFKKPKKDTCHKCDIYEIKKKVNLGVELEMINEWHDAHLARAEALQAQMKADCDAAKTDHQLETLTFDMQKTLPLPKVPTSIAYYKRQLNLYNLGIHSGSTSKGQFNLWTETEASKGTQEVGSCLKLHIENITKPIKRLILWSDSCGGQNRSIKLVLMMMFVLQNHKTLESISMRYLLSGHSFLPNDTEFGEAETALKRQDKLYTDEDYMTIMKECRNKNGFDVNRMATNDFFSIQCLEALITNRKLDDDNKKVSWLDTHEILIEKSQPGILKMRKNIDGPFQTVNIKKAKRELDVKDVILGGLWPTGRPLSKEKVKDLKELVELVPHEQRYFYEFLNGVQQADFIDDVDGFGESVDFEFESCEI